jgi:hypothetical protein
MSIACDLSPERDPRLSLTNVLRHFAHLFTASVFVATFTWLAFATLCTLQRGYGWSEMDWNGDGVTSIAEFLDASYVGKRPIMRGELPCLEYFARTDGRLVRIVCPA